MAKKKVEEETVRQYCPFCRALDSMRDLLERNSEFFDRLRQARIEVLEGIKSLIEARIEQLKTPPEKRRSVKKIEVSE